MTPTADSIVTELTAKLMQLQALADQVSEQDLLPQRLQEQLTALALAQQADSSSPRELRSDPPTPTTHNPRSRNQPQAYALSPSSFLGSPIEPGPASGTSALGPRTVVASASGRNPVGSGRQVITGFKAKSPVLPAGSPVNGTGEPEDLVALRSENSALRAELVRAGRVNEMWGKELVELRRRLGISVDELEALDGDSRGPFAPSHRTSTTNRRRSQRSSQPSTRSTSRDCYPSASPSTSLAATGSIAIPGAVSPSSSSLSPHSTAPQSRRLSLSSFSSSFNSTSTRGIGWSTATSPSTSYPVTIPPFPTPVASSPVVRGGGANTAFAVGLNSAFDSLVGRALAESSALADRIVPISATQATAEQPTRGFSEEDLLPSPPDASDLDPSPRFPTPRAARFAAHTMEDSSGDPTPLSTSPGSGWASAGAERSPRSFVAEEGRLRRARGASLGAADELERRLRDASAAKGKGRLG